MTNAQLGEINGRLTALYAICLAMATSLSKTQLTHVMNCLDSALFDSWTDESAAPAEFTKRSDVSYDGTLTLFRATLLEQRKDISEKFG